MIDSYVDGLIDAGWRGDRERVRRSYFGQLVLGIGVLEALNAVRMMIDANLATNAERRYGRSMLDIVERRSALTRELLCTASEFLAI